MIPFHDQIQLKGQTNNNYATKSLNQQNNVQSVETIQEQNNNEESSVFLSNENRFIRSLGQFRQCHNSTRQWGSKYVKPYQKYIYTFISAALTIIVLISYNRLRQKCPYTSQDKCLTKFIIVKLDSWIKLVLLNCFCGILQIYFLVRRKGYMAVTFAGVIQMFYLYIYSQQTISVNNYIGAVNAIHIMVIGGFGLLCVIPISLYKLKKKNSKAFVLVIIFLILIFAWFYIFKISNSCDYWSKGINGRLQNRQGLCYIEEPPNCWYNIINGWMDLSPFFGTCSKGSETQKTFQKYFATSLQQGRYIGMPNFSNFKQQKRNDQSIQGQVFAQSVGFDSLQKAKDSQQKFDVIFDSLEQQYHIQVQRNQTLINQRKQIWEKQIKSDSPPLAKNILILYVDTVGRSSMRIKLPKVVEWFKRFTVQQSYQPNKILNQNEIKDQSYEFYRYNSYVPWTNPNMEIMLFGQRKQKSVQMVRKGKNKFTVIFQYFRQRGYIVGASNTFCQTFSMGLNLEDLQYQISKGLDHQISAFACDPNFHDPLSPFGFAQGMSSSGKHCLYDRIVSKYAIEATQSFFNAYNGSDIPKIFFLQFMQAHEGTGQVVRYIDDPLTNMLNSMEKKGQLQDTMVVLISDHGNHIAGILNFFNTANLFIEKGLPGLLIKLPKSVNKVYRDTIRINQQMFITARNFHYFLNHLLFGKKLQDKRFSLLNDLTNKTSCAILQVSDQQCRCN